MLKKVLEYAGEYRKTTYLSIFVLSAAVLVNIIPYFLVYQMITPLLGYGTMGTEGMIWHVAGVGICGMLYAVLYVKGLSLSHESAYHTLQNIRISLQGKMEKQPLGTIQEKGIGVIKKMFIDDIESIELLLAHALPEGISNVAVPAFVFIAMFFVDWKLALLSLCPLPLGAMAMGIMYQQGTGRMGAYYEAAQKMNHTIVEYINGMEVVKVFNRDGESYRRFETDVKNYRDFTLDWYRVCWPWMALYNSLIPCIALFTLPVGAWFVLNGWSSLPDLVLVICMSFGIGAPLMRSMSFMSTLPQVNYKIESLERLMGAPPLKQTDRPFSGKDYSVSFENVRFDYKVSSGNGNETNDPNHVENLDHAGNLSAEKKPGKQVGRKQRDTEVLHGITFFAGEGSLTALVGESGSGKSTLAKLLVHFYDVTGGAVKIGGQDVRDMSIEALNEKISYVSQEQFLFNMSLMENIRLGKPGASDEEVMAAAEKAQCTDFLARLEHGIHTMAGDGGKKLSGGERQRISLARAILKNAPIIVLDEATAFIDPENEEKMNAAIAEIIRGKTVIVIAHRLYSIAGADQICVLRDGRLEAAGTHEELLKSSLEYQKLWAAAEGSAQWKVSARGEVFA